MEIQECRLIPRKDDEKIFEAFETLYMVEQRMQNYFYIYESKDAIWKPIGIGMGSSFSEALKEYFGRQR